LFRNIAETLHLLPVERDDAGDLLLCQQLAPLVAPPDPEEALRILAALAEAALPFLLAQLLEGGEAQCLVQPLRAWRQPQEADDTAESLLRAFQHVLIAQHQQGRMRVLCPAFHM